MSDQFFTNTKITGLIYISIFSPHLVFSRADCEHFEMDIPEFPEADELRADLDSYESMWSMYDEFSSGLNDLAKEDWISFR